MPSPAITLLLVVALSGVLASASIEREPVRVTHTNSGPKYDIDAVERTRVPVEQPEAPRVPFARPQQDGSERGQEDDEPIRHISIRRIFLVPISPSDDSNSMWMNRRTPIWAPPRQVDSGEESAERPSMFVGQTRPLWPFLFERPHETSRPHVLGADEASRSPTEEQPSGSEAREREDGSPDKRRQMIDPIQLMVELMRQTLNHASQSGLLNDLSKEAQGASNRNNTEGDNSDAIKPSSSEPNGSGATGDLDKPLKPTSTDETKEDIVEIEGKKYMRKTIINRHVGENIVFMTKRLMFIPLNETDSAVSTSTTTAPSSTDSPQTSTASVETTATSVVNEPTTTLKPSIAPEATEKADEQPASSTELPTTSTTQTVTEPTSAAPESTNDKSAERLVETENTRNDASSSTTTIAPTN